MRINVRLRGDMYHLHASHLTAAQRVAGRPRKMTADRANLEAAVRQMLEGSEPTPTAPINLKNTASKRKGADK